MSPFCPLLEIAAIIFKYTGDDKMLGDIKVLQDLLLLWQRLMALDPRDPKQLTAFREDLVKILNRLIGPPMIPGMPPGPGMPIGPGQDALGRWGALLQIPEKLVDLIRQFLVQIRDLLSKPGFWQTVWTFLIAAAALYFQQQAPECPGVEDPPLPEGADEKACRLFKVDEFNDPPGTPASDLRKRYETEGAAGGIQRAKRTYARLNKKDNSPQGGSPASATPAGWWAPTLPAGQFNTMTARGHLLADILGGHGNVVKNIIPICMQTCNRDMRVVVEQRAQALVASGATVDLEVIPIYNDKTNPGVPTCVIMRFAAKTDDGCTTCVVGIPNTTPLSLCPKKKPTAHLRPSCRSIW